MEHIFDITAMIFIVSVALIYLYRFFKKARRGCASVCSNCSGGRCQTKIKQFKGEQKITFYKH